VAYRLCRLTNPCRIICDCRIAFRKPFTSAIKANCTFLEIFLAVDLEESAPRDRSYLLIFALNLSTAAFTCTTCSFNSDSHVKSTFSSRSFLIPFSDFSMLERKSIASWYSVAAPPDS
jgi:hypothetical protein